MSLPVYTDELPPFWWLRPWFHAKRLSEAVFALNEFRSEQDDALAEAKNKLMEQIEANRAAADSFDAMRKQLKDRIAKLERRAPAPRKPVYVKKGGSRA